MLALAILASSVATWVAVDFIWDQFTDEDEPSTTTTPQVDTEPDGSDSGDDTAGEGDGGNGDTPNPPEDQTLSNPFDAKTISVISADGEAQEFTLRDIGDSDPDGSVRRFEISLAQGETLSLEMEIQWGGPAGDSPQEYDLDMRLELALAEGENTWDYREDGLTIQLFDENGTPASEDGFALDYLDPGNGADRLVVDNFTPLNGFGQVDNHYTVVLDALEPGEGPAPIDTSNTPNDNVTAIDPWRAFDSEAEVIAHIPEDTPGYVHLVKLSYSDGDADHPTQYEHWTGDLIIRTDSPAPPEGISAAGLPYYQHQFSMNPLDTGEILGGFLTYSELRDIDPQYYEGEDSREHFAAPSYSGKDFATVTEVTLSPAATG